MDDDGSFEMRLAHLQVDVLDLAQWAEDRLNDDAGFDRQYIVEYLIAAARAVALDDDKPAAPF